MHSFAGLLELWKGSAVTFLTWWRDELWGLVPEQVRVHLAPGETSLVVAICNDRIAGAGGRRRQGQARQSDPGAGRGCRCGSAHQARACAGAPGCAHSGAELLQAQRRAAAGRACGCGPYPRARSGALDAVQAEGCLHRRLHRRSLGRGRPDQGRSADRQAPDHRPDPGRAARRRPRGRFRRLLGRAGARGPARQFPGGGKVAAHGLEPARHGPAAAGGVRGAAAGRRCPS